jgi:hypothetical protein
MQTFFCDEDYRPYPSLVAEWCGRSERTAGWVCSWGEYLREGDGREVAATMRRHEGTGRPLGDRRVLEKVGRRLGRDLVPKKPGPTPKKKTKQRS